MKYPRIKNIGIRHLLVVSLPALLVGCGKMDTDKANNQFHSAACVGNAYLAKYDCSIERIQRAAESGNPDAQYALGYMYYYGISTVQDRQTAALWIKRAADQGQPLARRAWGLINSDGHFTDLHQAAQGYGASGTSYYQKPADVALMNAQTPSENIASHLPAYKRSKKPAALDVLKKQPETAATSEPAAASKPVPTTTTAPSSATTPAAAAQQASPLSMKKEIRLQDPRLTQGSKPIVAQDIQQLPKGKYTLQLMASHHLSDVKHYMQSNKIAPNSQYYQTKLNGKPWYFLTYGQFPTAAKAKAALKQLPRAVKASKPWVKSMASVHREVKLQKVVG